MNEKTETHEPLAAILAEMRDGIHTGRADIIDAVNERLRSYADRIEAASEREYEEAKDYFAKLHDGPSMICTAKNCAVRNIGLSIAASPRKFDEPAPGNAAALREALEKAWELLDGDDRQLIAYSDTGALMDIIKPALAAPARNADRFKTAEDAAQAYRRETEPDRQNADCYWPCIFDWLFAPAEGGAE